MIAPEAGRAHGGVHGSSQRLSEAGHSADRGGFRARPLSCLRSAGVGNSRKSPSQGPTPLVMIEHMFYRLPGAESRYGGSRASRRWRRSATSSPSCCSRTWAARTVARSFMAQRATSPVTHQDMRPRYRIEPCKSALNPVKGMPFKWSLNPYMGCVHRCTFCYVRHFEQRADRPSDDRYGRSIRVKDNVAEVLRHELGRPTWERETVSIG